MAVTKILACGSVEGKFSKFFKKISTIQKKNGPFELAICTGDFFSSKAECKDNWKAYLRKKEKVEIPLYILGPSFDDLQCFFNGETLEDGEEICENVIYLGRKGIFKTASGLVIAYLSGSGKTGKCCVKKEHVDSLVDQVQRDSEFAGIDLLVTAAWPQDVTKFSNTKIVGDSSSPLISQLATTLKPRYHLSCHKERFFERAPYRNHQVLREAQQPVTRFISLAPFANAENEKSLYAFSITPLSSMSHAERVKQPDVVTEFPYNDALAMLQDESQKQQQFFFADDSRKRKHDDAGGEHKKAPKGPPPLKSDCWFCLGSKDVEKHLVLSVGEHCYVAVAKGAINEDHILICPVNHYNSTVIAPNTVVMEMEKFKMCLRKMFGEENKEMVTYERNFYTQHLQLQVIGIPSRRSKHVKEAFLDYAEEYSLELVEVPEDDDIDQMVATTTPYFLVELPSGERLLHKVKGKMPLQFGREVVSSSTILNLPHRVDWKDCKIEKDEEVKQAKKFRERFRSFDFNFT